MSSICITLHTHEWVTFLHSCCLKWTLWGCLILTVTEKEQMIEMSDFPMNATYRAKINEPSPASPCGPWIPATPIQEIEWIKLGYSLHMICLPGGPGGPCRPGLKNVQMSLGIVYTCWLTRQDNQHHQRDHEHLMHLDYLENEEIDDNVILALLFYLPGRPAKPTWPG